MRLLFKKHFISSAIVLHFLVLAGCAKEELMSGTDRAIPVRLSTGYTMAELSTRPDSSSDRVKELSRLITAPWYASFGVRQAKSGVTVLSSCADYFDEVNQLTRTVKEYEMAPYLELKMMCEATIILIDAGASRKSFLRGDVLDAGLPRLWPKQIAFQISTEEAKRSAMDPNMTSWHDVNSITRYESVSPTKAIYFHNGGYQEVEIVGYGDVDSDGVEDLVVLISDRVVGGNYVNYRLFVLSVDHQGKWRVIRRI